ncbi:MAG: hypothetical protein J7K22_02520 [Nanoarchaeota archaeon]|nr:hypothetical protein [Nanoarchaeota archaeon]
MRKIIFIALVFGIALILGCIGTKEKPIEIQNNPQNISQNISQDNVNEVKEQHIDFYVIPIRYYAFNPTILRINPPATVKWVNEDEGMKYKIVSGVVQGHKEIKDGLFESNTISYGESWNFTFYKEGFYPYFIEGRPQIQGLIIVGNPKEEIIQINTPHFVGSIPAHNKTVSNLNMIWITFNVQILNTSKIEVYNVDKNYKVELDNPGVDESNFLRLRTGFKNELEDGLYKVNYTEDRPEGTFYGQFFFYVKRKV